VVKMGDLLIRTQPAQDLVLDKLTKMGIFKTRSEAIRAGIMGLSKEYNLFKSAQEIEDELVVKKMLKLEAEDKQGKRKYITLKDFKKKHNLK
jgi:Arc/MetJ-type ribon-helix-helix transcriptional regulator